MAFITTRDGQPLHVRVLGRGHPVLLMHGLGASGMQWLPFELPLLGKARFYMPDFRGAGGSFNEPLKFARELRRFIDAHAAPAAQPAGGVLQ